MEIPGASMQAWSTLKRVPTLQEMQPTRPVTAAAELGVGAPQEDGIVGRAGPFACRAERCYHSVLQAGQTASCR